MSLMKEFKEFAVKGNAVDMAVGLVIGAAFGKIVSSLVADVITPPLGLLIGGVDFSSLALTLHQPISGASVVLKYGLFIQTVFDFVIVAFAIFLLVKGVNVLRRTQPKPAAPAMSPQELLLAEIRDILKAQSGQQARVREAAV